VSRRRDFDHFAIRPATVAADEVELVLMQLSEAVSVLLYHTSVKHVFPEAFSRSAG
jgi:hypothetical protein